MVPNLLRYGQDKPSITHPKLMVQYFIGTPRGVTGRRVGGLISQPQ